MPKIMSISEKTLYDTIQQHGGVNANNLLFCAPDKSVVVATAVTGFARRRSHCAAAISDLMRWIAAGAGLKTDSAHLHSSVSRNS